MPKIVLKYLDGSVKDDNHLFVVVSFQMCVCVFISLGVCESECSMDINQMMIADLNQIIVLFHFNISLRNGFVNIDPIGLCWEMEKIFESIFVLVISTQTQIIQMIRQSMGLTQWEKLFNRIRISPFEQMNGWKKSSNK